jgi:hypothetical protein
MSQSDAKTTAKATGLDVAAIEGEHVAHKTRAAAGAGTIRRVAEFAKRG